MHASTVTTATLAALAALAAAVPTGSSVVAKRFADEGYPPPPSDLAPGVYQFSYDESGNPNNTRIADLDSRPHEQSLPAGPAQRLAKRANTYTNCESYTFTTQEAASVTEAWNLLWNQANGGDGQSPWGGNLVSLGKDSQRGWRSGFTTRANMRIVCSYECGSDRLHVHLGWFKLVCASSAAVMFRLLYALALERTGAAEGSGS